MFDALMLAHLEGDALALPALADWCEEQGLDDEAAFWRWAAAEGVSPYAANSHTHWWHDEALFRDKADDPFPRSNLPSRLVESLRRAGGRRHPSFTAAYLALRNAWLATPAAERPAAREGVA